MKAGVLVDFLHGTTDFTSFARADDGGIDPTMTASGTDHTDALTTGAYVQDHAVRGKLALDIGFRLDELHVILADGTTNDAAGASPRLGGSYSFTKDTVLHAFTGVNWQPPSPLDAADAARALGVVPANVAGRLRPQARDRHVRRARHHVALDRAAARRADRVGALRVQPARRHRDRLDEPACRTTTSGAAARPASRPASTCASGRGSPRSATARSGSQKGRASRARSSCSRRPSSPTTAGRRSITRRPGPRTAA